MTRPASSRRCTGGCYLIRLDDIAPNMNWDGYARAKRLFDTYKVRPLLGVIPDNQDPSLRMLPTYRMNFWDEMRAAQDRGWEIAMHGYRHLYDSRGNDLLGLGIRSEFAGHDFETQLSKLRNARAIFDREQLRVRTFFAPSHTFDRNTVRALESIGIDSISDGYGLFPYRDGNIVFVPQLLGRAIAFPLGVYTSCHHLNTMSEADFQALERFVERYHTRILSYAQAKDMETANVWNRACGAALHNALYAKRRLGRMLDRYRRNRRYGG